MELNFRILEKDNKNMCLWVVCVCSVLIYSLKQTKYDKNGSIWHSPLENLLKIKSIIFYCIILGFW